jgi:hypothetical protein
MDRYVGEISNIKPKFDDVNIIWIKREDWTSGNKHMCNPAFWFECQGWIYFGICKSYHFDFLEDFSDWDHFDEYDPKNLEFDHLMSLKPTFYKVDYQSIINGDLGDWCKFETDFLTEWWRNKQIDDIIK